MWGRWGRIWWRRRGIVCTVRYTSGHTTARSMWRNWAGWKATACVLSSWGAARWRGAGGETGWMRTVAERETRTAGALGRCGVAAGNKTEWFWDTALTAAAWAAAGAAVPWAHRWRRAAVTCEWRRERTARFGTWWHLAGRWLQAPREKAYFTGTTAAWTRRAGIVFKGGKATAWRAAWAGT